MDLLRALEEWSLVRPRAHRTLVCYRYTLTRMALHGIAAAEDASVQRLSGYVLMRRAKAGPASIKAELAALYSTLGHLVRQKRFPLELLRDLRALAPEVKRPKRFRAPHLDRSAFELLRASAASEEARFMISVDVLSGLRAGELARVRWEDLELGSEPFLRVKILPELGDAGTIKTGEERVVPICRELRELLVARREALGARAEGWIFRHGPRASKNAQASVKTLRAQLRRARDRAGLPWVTFHVLRHTRASWWVQAGVSLAKCAYFLGNSLEVCERYYAGLREGYDPDCERMPAA